MRGLFKISAIYLACSEWQVSDSNNRFPLVWFQPVRLLFPWFQYKTCKDGSVLGVTVTRIALLTHCQALTQSCCYTEGTHTRRHTKIRTDNSRSQFNTLTLSCPFLPVAETIVNVLDFKKDVGLWHGILTVRPACQSLQFSDLWSPVCENVKYNFVHVQSVMNMMHVISVPYSLMKVNPLSWIQKVCQYKGQTHNSTCHSAHSIHLSVKQIKC